MVGLDPDFCGLQRIYGMQTLYARLLLVQLTDHESADGIDTEIRTGEAINNSKKTAIPLR